MGPTTLWVFSYTCPAWEVRGFPCLVAPSVLGCAVTAVALAFGLFAI